MPAFSQDSNTTPLSGKRIALLVQAPLAQSPRMAAHTRMLLDCGAQVHVLGYGHPEDFPLAQTGLTVTPLPGSGRDETGYSTRFPLIRALHRTACMTLSMRASLEKAVTEADLLLAQVPPVVPGVLLAARQARRQGVPLVIDWHNLSGAMAALKLGPRHPAVHALNHLERRSGQRARGHLTVTRALAEHLRGGLRQSVTVLPDRPSSLQQRVRASGHTEPVAGHPSEGREAIAWCTVVSPTSWSLDEDMNLLLDAVSRVRLPAGRGLQVIATGKGPRRAAFEVRAAALQRANLRIETAWLSHPDYLGLLARADAGISLHRSASGLDFPMKIIDMEAAGLPVLALDYGPALREGLEELTGAAIFLDAAGLAKQLEKMLEGAGSISRPAARPETWEGAWTRTALPLFRELIS